jgi:hypothetical protein
MTKPNVFIRGIYSTALTQMFIDAGFPIIFPSPDIQKRFNIPFRPDPSSYSKDITIKDRLDRQGVSIMIKKKAWDETISKMKDFPLFQSSNPDMIVFKSRFNINSIYRGMIIKSNKQNNFSYIRLTPEEITNDGTEEEDPFRTTLGRYNRFMPDGKEGIFQITHEDCGKNYAYLGSYYTIPGDLVVIVPYDSKVIISKEIVNGRQKKRLFDLGKSIQQTKKYGFIFRTAAELASDEEILQEVENLEKDLIETQNTITKFPDRIGLIYENYVSFNILFPSQVKNLFDQIRRKVLPTLDNHHILKSEKPIPRKNEEEDEESFDEEETLLEYTEQLMEQLPSEMYHLVNRFYWSKFLRDNLKPRDSFEIVHQKLSARTLNLSPGFIQSVQSSPDRPVQITVKRKLREGGEYDGIGGYIEPGDYAIGEYEEGSWYYRTSYFSQNNEPKGVYFNINTPIQINKGGIRYIDLEIDVIENMAGERKIVDKEFLDKALALEIISQEVYDKAVLIAKNILEKKIA